MFTSDQVYSGIEKFMEHEILNKVPGWKKWILGTGLEMALNNAEDIVHNLKDNEFAQMLHLIDEQDRINAADIYAALKKQANTNEVKIDIPIIGTLTLNESDVDKLYNYIRES